MGSLTVAGSAELARPWSAFTELFLVLKMKQRAERQGEEANTNKIEAPHCPLSKPAGLTYREHLVNKYWGPC